MRYADLLIHVVDSSYENRDFYMEVTNKVIEQIGAGDKDQIVAYNKMDIAKSVPLDVSGHEVVYLSAKTGENINVLVEKIREKIFGGRVEMTLLIPYQRGGYHIRIFVKTLRYSPWNMKKRERCFTGSWNGKMLFVMAVLQWIPEKSQRNRNGIV